VPAEGCSTSPLAVQDAAAAAEPPDFIAWGGVIFHPSARLVRGPCTAHLSESASHEVPPSTLWSASPIALIVMLKRPRRVLPQIGVPHKNRGSLSLAVVTRGFLYDSL
jgi:hypothetical protein